MVQNLIFMHTGEDCGTCGPKVTSAEDVKDVDMPEWKKKALAAGVTADAANDVSIGMMNWDTEHSTAAKDSTGKDTDHSHEHSHGHS